MAVKITINDVPESVRDALVDKAESNRQTVQDFLLVELTRIASQPASNPQLSTVRRRKTAMGTHVSVSTILGARDIDRG